VSTPLNAWLEAHQPEANRSWRADALDQFAFVRNVLAPIVGAGLHPIMACGGVSVIAEHRSKSITLPVYHLHREVCDIYLRGNFYDWKLSVVMALPVPLEVNLAGLCHTTPPIEPDYTGNPLHPVYFEGFPSELIFGYYEQDKTRWSAEFRNDQSLATALFLIMRATGVVKPLTWHTRESHRAELDADRKRWDAERAARKGEP
jgi:hypothetical protein